MFVILNKETSVMSFSPKNKVITVWEMFKAFSKLRDETEGLNLCSLAIKIHIQNSLITQRTQQLAHPYLVIQSHPFPAPEIGTGTRATDKS